MENIFFYQTNIGKIGIVENGMAIIKLYLNGLIAPQDATVKETPLLREAAMQLQHYLAGKRKSFDLPFAPDGTEFQQNVWSALQVIPYGETRSYVEVAKRVGRPKAARAVGMANNKNPIPIFIPCHRVIGANGKLVGYAGGLDVKQYLLNLEKNI
ncbi:methylated-DNA-[protein]-cysteine S-methyltransferase [Sporomusaceae bacterium BoRhaA]|uniref:methylated-DNA--[protein]-cysteine S-methyltransferase n=1 Tax=Pelorhabdus rhamnosifermentans TaxID=2772457 RepID=UPI001C05ED85|nr:methylated-DNA--[protein]-cysteine S-methyltransferase [Pelorhabdus rhamnosifermentans]MBU2699947.1 methylated-DNA-[protein]-cysteine S-methyltransferase [Pelorhabdus rhamnosifermentans]